MIRLGLAFPCTIALAVAAAGAGASAQDPLSVSRVTCEGGSGEACRPPRVAPNVVQLREWQVGYFRRAAGARVVAAFDVSNDRIFWEFLAGWGTTTLGGPPPGEWTSSVYALPARDDAAPAADAPTVNVANGTVIEGDPADERSTDWDAAIATAQPRAKWLGMVTAPWDSLLLGLELIAPEDPAAPIAVVRRGAVGRARVHVAPPPQPAQRVQISDILLYEHDGGPVPQGLDGPRGAGTRALGTSTLGGRQRVGLYWEVYGLAAGEAARLELTIVPVIDAATSGVRARPVGIAWETLAWPNPAISDAWSQGFILDVATLKPGRHRMLVSVVVPGQEAVTAAREIRVVVGG
jgi:hypothetical protein